MNPRFFIGPMSKNIVDAIIEYCNENNVSMGLIPSRRQVDFKGGYVNNWTTETFCNYVRSKSDNILLVRDHGGPHQGENEDDGSQSFFVDCKPQSMDVIHVDVWKSCNELHDGIQKTIEYINELYRINPRVFFEVGTEESIYKMAPNDLDVLLWNLKAKLDPHIYGNIKYAVIQSGTSLKFNTNTGVYDEEQLIDMLEVVGHYGLLSKEHNGDYLPHYQIKRKFKLGLDALNIAPEFGQTETKIILEYIKASGDNKMFDKFFSLCLNSGKWKKWVTSDFSPEEEKESLINICGHYVFTHPDFLKIKEELQIKDADIREKIKNKIEELHKLIDP